MKLLLDEDSQGRVVIRLLREAGHDVLTVSEAGLVARSDAEVFALAQQEGRVLLTRNIRDFLALHDAQPEHPGILGVHMDKDVAKNMKDAEIVRAIDNLEQSGWDIAGEFVALNAWNYGSDKGRSSS